MGKEKRRSMLLFVCAIAISIPSLFVFYWMFSVSIKSDVDSTAYPPTFFQFTPTFHAYDNIFGTTPFIKYVLNTLIVSIGTVLAGLVIGLPAAYGIVRWKLQSLSVAILATRMIPSISFLVPWFLMFRTLRLSDTFAGLIMAQLTINLPMVIWLMIGFFLEIPKELHDSSRIDGCSEWKCFWKVMVPLTRQGIAASSILSFIYAWNNFLFPVILAGRNTKTLPAAVFSSMSFEQIDWSSLAAMASMVTLPVLILFLFTQKHIVAGLVSGSVKG
ncbi:carbohydrate ABC transporter permease [Paenibacillus sp. MSJ-34]|uniref:carbohydrate ABC transporter permease n=1 Tax=Paenibacillus sp. MSJ-34 TaxID=2841529 RepID=UPI001C0FE0BA|nr:carbohydrate ABC transporter permease [Paenibacillus sp. MSJ-34]MBU5442287.1 carbohydrate ABC transporter permease [Paenibacillus sp. MSJ-34]